MNHLHDAARDAHAAGLCVIPAAATGTKQPWPDGPSWKAYQTRPSTLDQVDTWFGGGRYDGMGVVTGAVSGNLEMLEFEGRAIAEDVAKEFSEIADASGLGDLWRKVTTGYAEQTPSGGIHVLYRVDGDVAGNAKLASRPATAEELAENPKEKIKVLIETRGEGGFVVVAPSAGRTHPSGAAWTLISGGFATIATITPAERDALHHLAGALDQMPADEQPVEALPFTQPARVDDDGSVRPGDDFNERATWDDIIGVRGWTRVHTDTAGTSYWRRPGKARGISATTGRGGMDNLYVFSTSTEFEAERPYDKFGAYTLLTQGSTSPAAISSAAKDLAGQGYGRRADQDDPRDLIAPTVDGNLATVHQLHPAPAAGPGTQHRGHLRMAERFVAEHAEQLRYVHGIGWHRWDGTRWAADDQRADLQAAVATTKNALSEAITLKGQDRDDLLKDARKAENASGAEGMLKFAAALPPISTASSALDADPYLFNTPGGTLDLETGTVRPNNRADLITKVAGAAPRPDHGSEWAAFLARILPDPEVRAFVQRVFGYAMLGKVTEHVMLIFTGTGANGKGTTRDALMAAFGDYAIEIDPAMLMESKHERHGAFKMRLRGARLVFCSETEKGRRFAEATMKRLVGGDPIEANLMHKNPITFLPSHTLIMLTNHLPAVSGDDPAVWRRLLVVPFDVVIPASEQDNGLPDRLKAAAPTVIAWAYQGWLDYQQQGLNPPDAVRRRTEAYQADSDALGRFLDERTMKNPHSHVKARELFTAWTQWCYVNGEDPGSEKAFAESMGQRGHEKKRGSGGFTYRGLVLMADDG
ncbi:bifunctional DNA primase/polymerase [Nonomuraea sp. SMC257]|uniref:Bifunctional DNA primase/polymerase n=1 Tax=Nonomuraea montanisoli TaxID=2741721 RepID=A0A7Y6M372_9ACTN|nr:phage/plasmid primase, P4 family [Nonomuraea montanisoli]NUW33423.1 bifunctional DNA primase/polymerase [Nonomuraea montanisoli]